MGKKKRKEKKEAITLSWNNKFEIREKPGKFKDTKEISVNVMFFFSIMLPYTHTNIRFLTTYYFLFFLLNSFY
jgi:hypothetical protein